jgi:hypothetical protein
MPVEQTTHNRNKCSKWGVGEILRETERGVENPDEWDERISPPLLVSGRVSKAALMQYDKKKIDSNHIMSIDSNHIMIMTECIKMSQCRFYELFYGLLCCFLQSTGVCCVYYDCIHLNSSVFYW